MLNCPNALCQLGASGIFDGRPKVLMAIVTVLNISYRATQAQVHRDRHRKASSNINIIYDSSPSSLIQPEALSINSSDLALQWKASPCPFHCCFRYFSGFIQWSHDIQYTMSPLCIGYIQTHDVWSALHYIQSCAMSRLFSYVLSFALHFIACSASFHERHAS